MNRKIKILHGEFYFLFLIMDKTILIFFIHPIRVYFDEIKLLDKKKAP